MSDDYAAKNLRFHDSLKTERAPLHAELQDVVDYVRPSAGSFISPNQSPNQPRTSVGKLYDDTAVNSLHLFASGLMSMTVRPDELWMNLLAPDEALNQRDDVRLWLYQATSAMYSVFNSPKLGFYPSAHTFALEAGSFGTMVTGQFSSPKNFINFNTRFLGECYIGQNMDGEANTVSREFRVPASDFQKRFGSVPEVVQKELGTGRPNTLFDVVHMVTERDINDTVQGSKTPGNKPFSHDYFLVQSKETLSKGGHDEFPWQVSRWTQYAGDTYGRGCAIEALPSIRMLNQMSKDNLRVGNIAADPAWQVPDDGFMLPLRTSPRSVNYYRAGDPDSRAYPLRSDFSGVPFSVELEDRRARMVQRMFYTDLMLSVLNKNKEMTLGEVQQIVEEQSRMMVPYVLRLQKEWLSPMIDRVFAMCYRAGIIPPPPDVLKGRDLVVEYRSPISQAQKSVYAVRLQRAMSLVTPIAQVDQSVLDNLNLDRTTKWLMADVFGLPASVLNNESEVKQIRTNRAKVSMEESQKQDMMAAADAQAKLTKANAAAAKAGVTQ